MSQERIAELNEHLFYLERKIKPLEWDLSRSQINEFKKRQVVKLKEELGTLTKELNELQQE